MGGGYSEGVLLHMAAYLLALNSKIEGLLAIVKFDTQSSLPEACVKKQLKISANRKPISWE